MEIHINEVNGMANIRLLLQFFMVLKVYRRTNTVEEKNSK